MEIQLLSEKIKTGINKHIDDPLHTEQMWYDLIYSLIPFYYTKNVFIVVDMERPKGRKVIAENDIYYKLKTGHTSRPYIPLSQEELNWLLEHPNEIKIASLLLKVKGELKSRNFDAAKQLLPLLGKLNNQDYSQLTDPDIPNCILLRLFNIQSNDELSLKINKSRHSN